VKAAGAVIAAEGAVALVVGVVELIRGLGMEHGRGAFGLTFWLVPVGVALFAAGFGLIRGKRWGRSVGVLMSVMITGAGVSGAFSQGRPEIGVPLIVLGVVVLLLLFAPATVAWLGDEPAGEPE
jgi:hypothetical protein